jgi:hypothetical protein
MAQAASHSHCSNDFSFSLFFAIREATKRRGLFGKDGLKAIYLNYFIPGYSNKVTRLPDARPK